MVQRLLEILNILAILTIICLPFLKIKGMGIFAVSSISIQAILGAILSVLIFFKGSIEYYYQGSWTTGPIPIRIDYLSAWFILILSFTFFTGAWYGLHYMKKYTNQPYNLTLHSVAYLLAFTSLIDLCAVQNSFVMLVIWELMALSSFVLIIFDHQKAETIKAGINFLIQSHICILFLTLAFIWVRIETGTFDFNGITGFTTSAPALAGVGLFLFFFFGFAIKAGFVPFHTWLPLAHPAAPSHISGVMSGVIIKIGIYGIFRIVLLMKTDMAAIGYFMLTISVFTGVYGVMLAIIQHDVKKLLAYHSIENIGIIGIGIGLGCLGINYENNLLIIAGFGGSLLHTLNHSLFKSLLFYTTGNVYQARHTMNIEALGGLIKKLPHTALLFLIGSLAICGLPPFNGFVSEFFIYSGLFHGLVSDHFGFILFMLFTILGLVLIGGLAVICFTKAFGMIFLGNPRRVEDPQLVKEKINSTVPLYLIGFAILLIGLFPFLIQTFLLKIIQLFQTNVSIDSAIISRKWFKELSVIGWYSIGLVALTFLIYSIRYLLSIRKTITSDSTWGCGYRGDTSKMQYSASSFIRLYRKLAEPVLQIKKKKLDAQGLYPRRIEQSTQPEDKLEYWFIDKPVNYLRRILNRFVFLQNGNIQAYILYGFLFVGLALLLPVLIDKLMIVINFLNQL
jgi:hydrogenase-4 component B